MYSIQLLATPEPCAAGCGTTVRKRIAGHYFRDPLCDPCFRQAAPELSRKAMAFRGSPCIRGISAPALTCQRCERLLTSRVAGYHLAERLCAECLFPHSEDLGLLLWLQEAALQAARGVRDDEALFKVLREYIGVCSRLEIMRARARKKK